MLVYVESNAFPIHSFTLQCNPNDTMARVRAHLLHILYQMGHEDHQFRMRYKGQYLRDAYTLDDYHIGDHCVLKMVPMAKRNESFLDVRGKKVNLGGGQSMEIKRALIEEVSMLKWREKMFADFHGILSLNRVFILFAALMFAWYFLCPYRPWQYGTFLPWAVLIYCLGICMITLYTMEYGPSYTHRSGFTGPSSLWPKFFLVAAILLTMINWAVDVFLTISLVLSLFSFSCITDESADSCMVRSFWSYFLVVYFALHTLYMFVVLFIAVTLIHNLKFTIGDYLEGHLVVTRDVEKVIELARNGRMKERRQAVFELATLATSGDDSKFRIVAEGGLELLISSGLSTDEATQEYAIEAIAELLTIPAIQEQFVELGGVTTLTTLLHSHQAHLIQEAVTAISYIVADSDGNKQAVIADHGLRDLAHAVSDGNTVTKRNVAGVYLDLVFSPDIRAQMASQITTTTALVSLCTSDDSETLRLALQTLELIAIEGSDVILYQEDLVGHLLNIPRISIDSDIYLLAGKILLYFAENPESCERLTVAPNLHHALMEFVKTRDAILQKVVARVIQCILEDRQLVTSTTELKAVLVYIRGHAGDREAWNMADEGIVSIDSIPSSTDSFSRAGSLAGSLLSIKKPPLPEYKEVSRSMVSLSKPGPSHSSGTEPLGGGQGSQQSLPAAVK